MTYEVAVRRGVRIGPLGADLFLPVGAGPVPAVVALMPYRRDSLGGAGCWTTLRRFAAAGYAAVLVDCRGLGSSDGPARPPFDPAEADDGVAAVEWAAEQPWCSGAVGMWGFSWGAALALRTATRRPEPLRAVVSLMGLLDPELDFVHPGGARGMVGPLAVWGLGTLVNQLLPPLRPGDAADRRRWQERVEHAEPYLVDVARHPPGHPAWRSRAIDAAAVTVPTLSVGGWRDMFCDAAVRIHERVRAPRALVVGPWMHSAPDDAPDEPLDATALALRWWSRWLTAAAPEPDPAVTVFVQGDRPGWRSMAEWPPATDELRLVGRADGLGSGPPRKPLGCAPSDPTVGTLSGLWGIPNGGFGRPADQAADDARAVALTGDPLAEPLLLAGRPAVTLSCAGARRLVVKLTDVDPAGRSTLITGGILTGTTAGTVDLDPTCYRVAAGHRLRVVVSDSAFPRLWPEPGDRLEVRRLELRLPAAGDLGPRVAVERPSPAPDGGWVTATPRWEITGADRVEVIVADELQADLPSGGPALRQDVEIRASAGGGGADLRGTSTVAARLASGEHVVVRAELCLDGRDDAAAGEVTVDGVVVADRRWSLGPEPGRPGLVPAWNLAAEPDRPGPAPDSGFPPAEADGGDESGEQQHPGPGDEDGAVAGDQRPVAAG